ncbi:Protein CBG25409 [Caenorhabditis briggsae]|uniref:Protein CBG25409 n=1 Tax=Caenorhabditis briggsae TaxID=6238 RepID=B6IIX9_CAEBR|nr:Protein CBG25409 [Caenorhabditis briggsae]CAR99859.1 Protein CBG25409 [Caenorhabditis briggsae]
MENAYKANREILKKGVGIEQSDIEADIKRKALEKRFKDSKDKKIKDDMMEKKREQEEQEKRRKKKAKEPESTKRRTEDCNSEKAFNSKHKKMEQKTKPSAIQKKKEKTWSLQKTQGTLEEPPTTKRNTNMEKELGDEQFSSVFTKKKKTATRKK